MLEAALKEAKSLLSTFLTEEIEDEYGRLSRHNVYRYQSDNLHIYFIYVGTIGLKPTESLCLEDEK